MSVANISKALDELRRRPIDAFISSLAVPPSESNLSKVVATHRDFVMLLAEAEPKPDVPISIICLPEDPFEAEAAKAKFSRTVNQLHRIFPDILEAKSVIKSKFSRPGKERGRYEVTVHIRTARKSYAYSDSGWELSAVYDHITDRLKRLMTQKRRRITREREQLEIT